jgi:hypothetical protein
MATRGATASHTFLKLHQPVEENNYPASRVFQPQRTYTFPYKFVIPEHLPPVSCNHKTDLSEIKHAHTKSPPTLRLTAGSQQLCEISYLIRVTISQRVFDNHQKRDTIIDYTRKLHVIPSLKGRVHSGTLDDLVTYVSRTELQVKSRWKRRALGRLVAVASMPKPIGFLFARSHLTSTVDAIVTVHLQFEPVGASQPPRLRTVFTTLKALTLISTTPWKNYPRVKDVFVEQIRRWAHVETKTLPAVDISSTQWTRQTSRQSTNFSIERALPSDSTDEPTLSPTSTDYFYKASVIFPISLPRNRGLLPTFHSCFVSRTYALELHVSYHMPDASILPRIMMLETPVTVTTLGNQDGSCTPSPQLTEEREDELSPLVVSSARCYAS